MFCVRVCRLRLIGSFHSFQNCFLFVFSGFLLFGSIFLARNTQSLLTTRLPALCSIQPTLDQTQSVGQSTNQKTKMDKSDIQRFRQLLEKKESLIKSGFNYYYKKSQVNLLNIGF